MITAQMMIYRYNGILTAKEETPRNQFELHDINVKNKEEFHSELINHLDCLKPGSGYILIKWFNKLFTLEIDQHNPSKGYVKTEISYHPLMNVFKL